MVHEPASPGNEFGRMDFDGSIPKIDLNGISHLEAYFTHVVLCGASSNLEEGPYKRTALLSFYNE